MSASGPIHLEGKRVFVAGETGLVGQALCRRLQALPVHLLFAPHAVLDLTDMMQTQAWFARQRPDLVIMAAGRVGGIAANAANPRGFYYDNWLMARNIIHAAAHSGVEKFLYLGSSCIYPKYAVQPLAPSSLMSGRLEKTNQGYALAKLKAIRLCRHIDPSGNRFITALPTNLYGPGDHYDTETSHVIPALIQKIHDAKMQGQASVTVWGSGRPLREFLHVDDLAAACLWALRFYASPVPLNIGSGVEYSIGKLAETIAGVLGYDGHIIFDSSRPDGTPRKLLDNTVLEAAGWSPCIPFQEGLAQTYQDFLRRQESLVGNLAHG